MLACDLILQVRASGSLSAEQVVRLERLVFGAGKPSREELDMLFLIDRYVLRADASWGNLLARAAIAALVAGAGLRLTSAGGGEGRSTDVPLLASSVP